MEEDNEILDWGNEDDEHNETLRKSSFNRDTGELDAEDSISLGDEDEDTSDPQTTLLTTGAKQDSQQFSGETTHETSSTPRQSSLSEDSPRRKQHSRDLSSQRSQPNPGRLTHALPPKPVTTKVPPYLPPSHPSIVEATSMTTRAGGRETKKSNGVSSATSIPSTADELPHNWEYREARNGGGRYYYNTETHLCTWEKPVSSVPSASTHAEPRSRRRRSSSTGPRHRSPSDSDPHPSQTTRPSRNSAHMPPDREMDDSTKTAHLEPITLSYEDRHYRPSGEQSSAAIETRATERHPEAVNGRVSSQSRYDRMPPASPPPSRRRARSPFPRESRASYLHEKEYQSSRGNSHSARGQNPYTNDPQRDFETLHPDPGYVEHPWVRTSPPADFPRSDRDSSRRRGRRQNDDVSMIDEHLDSRNRSSLRRREGSHEPNWDQDLPPRPSDFREDTNQNPAAPRRGSTPPHTRDRDQPIIRDFRAPPEDDPRSIGPSSSQKNKSLRHDGPAPPAISSTVNAIPSGPKINRPRDLDLVPSSNFTHPSRRVGEREYDRNRREQQILERDGLPRRPEYPPPVNQVPEQSKRHYDREPPRPHPSDFDRSSQDHVGQQSSHRKRTPLPPQATTFLTSSIAPAYVPGPENGRPRTSSTLAPPPQLPGDNYREMREFDRSRQEPSGMKEERMDRYSRPRSRSRGRSGEYMRAPSQPSSGTNNIPIGNRRPSVPPAIPYNPDARPPPSTLIDPIKARELLPPGKECYERPADLEIADIPQAKTVNDVLIHNDPRPSQHSESSERQPALPPAATAPGKPRQRKSRFGKLVPQPEPRKEPSPVSDMGMRASQSEASDMRAVTPPPPSREPSVQSLQDQVPPPLPLPAHPSNALVSSWSGQRSGTHWGNDTRGIPPKQTVEQPQQHLGLPDPPTSLSHRLSDDKRQHFSGGPTSGPGEGKVELSFHNAHAELERESEEGAVLQEGLDRPQMQRRGASLLDRLSTGNSRPHDSAAQQSLRDRIIPSKRDLEDMMDDGMHDVSFDGEDGTESKRARRKNGRARTRGGRRGGPV